MSHAFAAARVAKDLALKTNLEIQPNNQVFSSRIFFYRLVWEKGRTRVGRTKELFVGRQLQPKKIREEICTWLINKLIAQSKVVFWHESVSS